MMVIALKPVLSSAFVSLWSKSDISPLLRLKPDLCISLISNHILGIILVSYQVSNQRLGFTICRQNIKGGLDNEGPGVGEDLVDIGEVHAAVAQPEGTSLQLICNDDGDDDDGDDDDDDDDDDDGKDH